MSPVTPTDRPTPFVAADPGRRRARRVLIALGTLAGGVAAACLLLAAPAPLAADQAAEGAASADSPFRNVRILTDVTSKSEMRRIMKAQAKALGVKCTHCHVPGKFHLDDKEAKQVGFEMMRMVEEINDTWFADHEGPQVTCWTCHQGALAPESTRPDGEDGEDGEDG